MKMGQIDNKKKSYEKPRIIHRKKMDVMAPAVCDSTWTPATQCRLTGCERPRF